MKRALLIAVALVTAGCAGDDFNSRLDSNQLSPGEERLLRVWNERDFSEQLAICEDYFVAPGMAQRAIRESSADPLTVEEIRSFFEDYACAK